MSEQQLTDRGKFGKYFTQMYNMADDDLNPYQYRLLAHYKRVCGEDNSGVCFESTRTTAKICQMSTGKVSKVRWELVDLGYIEYHEAEGTDAIAIIVLDRMLENVQRYVERNEQRANERKQRNRSPHEQQRSPYERDRSPDEPEEERSEEEPEKKESPANAEAGKLTETQKAKREPKSKKEPKYTPEQRATADRMIAVLKDLLGVAPGKDFTASERGNVYKVVWQLIDAGYDERYVRPIYKYCERSYETFGVNAIATNASKAVSELVRVYGYDPITTVLEVDDAAEGTPPQPDEDAPVDESTLIDATAAFEELGRAISGNRIAAAGKR